jgi:hypothetical protein
MSSGYVYIIRNSLVPNGFKVGMSTMPVVSASGKFIGRIQSYGSTFPFGVWEVLHLQKCRNARTTEDKLIKFFKNLNYDSPGKSNEWFIGNWEEVYKQRILEKKNQKVQMGSIVREVKKRKEKERKESEIRLQQLREDSIQHMKNEFLSQMSSYPSTNKVQNHPYYEHKRKWYNQSQSSFGRY